MRKNTRLHDFDYSSNNAYFVTMCTHLRRFLLWDGIEELALTELQELPGRFPGVTVDCARVMADHVHVIFQLTGCKLTLSRVLQAYKSITTRLIRQQTSIDRVWQRSFYDRVIRNEQELAALREYVLFNQIVHALRDDPGAEQAPPLRPDWHRDPHV